MTSITLQRDSFQSFDKQTTTSMDYDDDSCFTDDDECSGTMWDDSSEDFDFDLEQMLQETTGLNTIAGKPAATLAPSSTSLLSINALRGLKKQTCDNDQVKTPVGRSISSPSLRGMQRIVDINQATSAQDQGVAPSEEDDSELISPTKFLQKMLEDQGRDASPISSALLEEGGYFEVMGEDNIAAYEGDVVAAFRQSNFYAIKKFHAQGRNLQCCNKFRESVVHLVCRRGSYDILCFLMDEANLSIRLRCDSGRTPLHDACWTSKPNFQLVKHLITVCPEFLLITDNRDFSPLTYIPRSLWRGWNDFLEENKDLILQSLSDNDVLNTFQGIEAGIEV